MPENPEQPAEAPSGETPAPTPTPAAPAPEPSAQAPIITFRNGIENIQTAIGQGFNGIFKGIRDNIGIVNPDRPLEEGGIIKTAELTLKEALIGPPIAAVIKPATEIAEVAADITAAAIGTILEPLKHPLETIKHPINYLVNNPLRAVSATIIGAVNFIPRRIDDAVNGFAKPLVQRLTNKIPLVGGLISKSLDAVGWMAKIPKKITTWFTGKLETPKNFTKAAPQE